MSMKLPKGRPPIERVIYIGIAFLVQIIWYLSVFTEIVKYSPYIEWIFTLSSILMILYLILKDESPAYRLSWIIIIALMPLFGGVLYLSLGNKRPTQGLRKQIESQRPALDQAKDLVPDVTDQLAAQDCRLAGLSQYINDTADAPLYKNSHLNYFKNGESVMDQLLTDLRSAKKNIFIEFFIVEYGQMFDQIYEILKAKAAEGLDVRFIYDDFGSITRLPDNFVDLLAADGIKALKFNPVRLLVSMVYNTRDHRKFIIIDDEIGYTGGINLADEYINVVERFGYWKDTVIRVQGQAVWSYTSLFLAMWNAFKGEEDSYLAFAPKDLLETKAGSSLASESATHFIQPYGDDPLDSNPVGENTYRQILNLAVDYVYIYTPYLVISYEMQQALVNAVQRGVDVRLMTPGIPDKKVVFRMTRSFYRPILEAGVRIFEYSPGFLHAKSFVSDDKVAVVGTINLDYRSLYLHFETGTIMYFHPEIKAIRSDFEESQAISREVFITDVRPSFFGAMWDAILRIIAPFV